MKFAFIQDHVGLFPVDVCCQTLAVSRAGSCRSRCCKCSSGGASFETGSTTSSHRSWRLRRIRCACVRTICRSHAGNASASCSCPSLPSAATKAACTASSARCRSFRIAAARSRAAGPHRVLVAAAAAPLQQIVHGSCHNALSRGPLQSRATNRQEGSLDRIRQDQRRPWISSRVISHSARVLCSSPGPITSPACTGTTVMRPLPCRNRG